MKRWLGILAGVALLAWYASQLSFLWQPANFAIGDTGGLPFSPEDTIGRAIVIGLFNTLRVSVIGCVLAVALGFALGIARLSGNPSLSWMIRGYVEIVRSTPLLLLLFLITALLHQLPPPAHALHPLPGVFLSDRGLNLPGLDLPRRTRFDFVGGIALSPELAALLFALVLHQSAHIAEVVRGAMLAVPRGQTEASFALGLSRWQTLRFVTVPIALRAMVPLLAGNCVSVIKNSSLAVAIGFPEVVSVLNTVGNQTGRNVETMVIMVAVYLGVSLTVAYALNRYNARITA
jgi:general L-amino acid transport system permease protein